jgi:signal transduction histidine kinase
MIRRLRLKFVLINMSLVVVVLTALCLSLFFTTRQSLEEDSLTALTQALTFTSTVDYSSHLTPDEANRPDTANNGSNGLSGVDKVQLPYLTVQVTSQNTIYVLANQFFDTSQQDALIAIVSTALQGEASGIIRQGDYRLRYLRMDTLFGCRIAFVDRTQELSTLESLGWNLGFITLGALAIFLFISLLLAWWAVRPVERSWKQQRQFVADASHELKTPLAVILSSLDMLEHYDDAEPEKRQRWLENVKVSSQQMKTLVEEMLSLARSDNATQTVNLAPCNLSELVEEDVLLFEAPAFEQGKQLETDLEENINVVGDAALLRRVLDIYLDNACKYAANPSTIRVGLHSEGKRAVLSVHSQGTPIPKEQLSRIFERFYRMDPSRTEEGYGLGLAIAQELAKLHHGKVWAQSDESGNTFFLSIPKK